MLNCVGGKISYRSAHPGVCEGVLSSDHRGNDEDTILER
jgi:hypothetical protein